MKTRNKNTGKGKLRVSAYGLDQFLIGCKRFFCGEDVVIFGCVESGLEIHNSKGKIQGYKVTVFKTRYRLREEK